MKAALAIAAAEIRQNKLVFWAGILLGFLPLVLHYFIYGAPLRPSKPGQAGTGAEGIVWVTAINLSLAIALGVGSGVVSRDLGERRLGFWLSRPLPLLQYWAAKIGAAYLLAVVAAVLAMLPAHLLGSMSWTATAASLFDRGVGGRTWLGALALAVAAGNAAGGAFRSRSGLLVLDIVMAPLVGAAAWLGAIDGIYEAGTDAVVMLIAMPWFLLATAPVLLAAGCAQVCVGRLELRRGHALLSAITWGGLLVFFVGGIIGFSRYVGASATPADLRLPHASLSAPRSGDHVMIESISARWNHLYHPGFLLDAQGGFRRIGGVEGLSGFGWSRDGDTFAWSREATFPMTDAPKSGEPPFSHGPGREPTIQVVRDLGRPGSAPRQLDPEVEYDSALRAVSPSGQRLLLESWRGKQVVDVEAGRRLTSVDDPEHWTRAAFLSESTIRALRTNRRPAATPPKGDLANQLGVPLARALGAREWNADARAAYPLGQATVVDWDLESGQLTERGTIAIQGARSLYAGLTPTEDWQRLLRLDGSGLYVHDLDGRVVATLVDGWGARTNRAAGPFSGGRVGCVEEGPSRLRLRVFDSEGRIVSDAWLEGRFPLRVGGELAPGVLSLGVSDEGEPATLIVDLLTGSVVRRERGLSPALRLWEAGIGLAAAVPEPGSLGTRVFVGDDGLVSLDPGTGARSVLVARRSRIEER